MSLSSCEKCWDNPCTCGHQYKHWTTKQIQEQINMLLNMLREKENSQLEVIEIQDHANTLLKVLRENAIGDS